MFIIEVGIKLLFKILLVPRLKLGAFIVTFLVSTLKYKVTRLANFIVLFFEKELAKRQESVVFKPL